MLRASGFADFSSYAAHLRLRHPILLEGEPLPRLRSGAICLNDPAQAKATLAVFFAGDDASNF